MHSVVYMSKQLIHSLHNVRLGATPKVFSVYVDTVDTVNKQHTYTIHNSIALILCIDHLGMLFNVHTTDKVTMITVSGFLAIYFEVGLTVIQRVKSKRVLLQSFKPK